MIENISLLLRIVTVTIKDSIEWSSLNVNIITEWSSLHVNKQKTKKLK